jgi:Cdc6-like AAA superfamily ATPase
MIGFYQSQSLFFGGNPMNTSKLLIVEGIPGSGKTTTAKWLAEVLKEQDKETELFLEGDPNHPADYESVACLTVSQLNELEREFPEIRSFAVENGKWYFVPYASFYECQPNLHKALQKYDVYELPVRDYLEVTLMKWKEFAERAEAEDKVYVLECCFLQNPFTFLLAKLNIPIEDIYKHLGNITETIKSLNPAIFYFEQDNLRDSLNRVRSERSIEWFEFLTWYYTEQDYGKAHKLQGEEGVIHFLEERKKLEKESLSLLPINSLILNNSQYDWDLCKQKIKTFLKIRLC